MKNLMIERLRDALRDAYPPGQATVRSRDLEWILDQVDPPKQVAAAGSKGKSGLPSPGPAPSGRTFPRCPCGDPLQVGGCTLLHCKRSAK